jgi:hypothetical protein
MTVISLAIAEVVSATPNAGGAYKATLIYSPSKSRRLLSWIAGCMFQYSVENMALMIHIHRRQYNWKYYHRGVDSMGLCTADYGCFNDWFRIHVPAYDGSDLVSRNYFVTFSSWTDLLMCLQWSILRIAHLPGCGVQP